jgi:WD40 repeat protein
LPAGSCLLPSALCSESLLLSGSLDATVKLWAADAVLTSGGERGGKEGAEEVPPLAEFNLHSAVLSVAIDSRGTVAAAGAEDGTVMAWELRNRTLLFSYAASNAGE